VRLHMTWNNWFVIILSIACLILYSLLPKRFHTALVIVTWVYSVIFLETLDFLLGLSPYDFYDFMDNPKYEPGVALLHLIVYPVFSITFLSFYDKWRLRGTKLAFYILFWTVLSVGVEWLAVLNNVLTYKEWKLLYSIPTYPIAIFLLIGVYQFAKQHCSE
jgi:hypothetical protein